MGKVLYWDPLKNDRFFAFEKLEVFEGSNYRFLMGSRLKNVAFDGGTIKKMFVRKFAAHLFQIASISRGLISRAGQRN